MSSWGFRYHTAAFDPVRTMGWFTSKISGERHINTDTGGDFSSPCCSQLPPSNCAPPIFTPILWSYPRHTSAACLHWSGFVYPGHDTCHPCQAAVDRSSGSATVSGRVAGGVDGWLQPASTVLTAQLQWIRQSPVGLHPSQSVRQNLDRNRR